MPDGRGNVYQKRSLEADGKGDGYQKREAARRVLEGLDALGTGIG